jgi:pyruvate/2-oxoglutarate dehydrogenase complex dihydrolipoamide dehydrogenase (E3) component
VAGKIPFMEEAEGTIKVVTDRKYSEILGIHTIGLPNHGVVRQSRTHHEIQIKIRLTRIFPSSLTAASFDTVAFVSKI